MQKEQENISFFPYPIDCIYEYDDYFLFQTNRYVIFIIVNYNSTFIKLKKISY